MSIESIKAVIGSGCVLYFSFEERGGDKAYDLSGNNNHAAVYGAGWTYGKIGSGLSFDGVDDYAKVEPFTVYGWKGISIVRWVKLPSYKPNTYHSKSFMIGDLWTDKPSFYHGYSNTNTISGVSMVFTTRKPDGTAGWYGWGINVLDKWVFVVDTFDLESRVRKGYLNAELKYSATIPENEKTILEWNPDTATYPIRYKRFTIGCNVIFGEFVNEVVDEVMIFNRALSEKEIKSHYYRALKADQVDQT